MGEERGHGTVVSMIFADFVLYTDAACATSLGETILCQAVTRTVQYATCMDFFYAEVLKCHALMLKRGAIAYIVPPPWIRLCFSKS